MTSSALPPVRLRDDRAWVLRFLRLFLLAFAAIAAWIFLYGFFDRKIHTTTGPAKWIWIEHDLPSREPVAFAAVRDFVPPEGRRYAWLSVAAHPEYSVSLNGRVIGSGSSTRVPTLDRYEIGPLLEPGTNRIVIRARSKDGVGGVLASIDYAPDRRNEVATPDEWKVTRNLAELSAGTEWEAPVVIGAPPIGPWNIPPRRERAVMDQAVSLVEPVSVSAATLSLPEITVLSGVAVVRERQEAARVFDFGRELVGRLRFTRAAAAKPQVVPWRTADDPSRVAMTVPPESAVLAAGESQYETPGARSFRYVVVYDPLVDVMAVQ